MVRARAAVVGRRLCLGTWRQLEAWARWLSGKTHADRPGIVRLGVILRRFVASVLAAVFYSLLLQRVPGGIYLLPVVWAIGAWQMSDTSATPPPREVAPESAEAAGRRRAKARGVTDPNGVMCIVHPVREEVTDR
ncbi:hypothetical protein CTZ28_12530 [Streptomyces shenzhenensis]|uniref:Uncharacterized protein n=1 Tax=Streptomyces shenzhenensis TaxID=943815 RepID=A0A3M0IB16_9ACTN|nr:hypothetical protein CTZ28_12530 [Streptomyces shenzhenensis]